MTRVVPCCLLFALAIGGGGCDAHAQSAPVQIPVRPFVLLPADVRHPESLAVNPASGDIYVGTFDAREPATARNNQLLRLSASGEVLARVRFGASPLTGIAFADDHVYVLDFGAAALQRLPAVFASDATPQHVVSFGALSPPAPPSRRVDNPDGSHDDIVSGSNGAPGVNGLLFDDDGNAYVSDSFQGAIYRIADATTCDPCRVDVLSRDPLLATAAAALPFGANGLAFDDDGTLHVNNAGDGRVLRVPLDGAVHVFAESVHGADGLLFHDGLLWVAANQADAVVALDRHGRERFRAGGFAGIDADGAPRGLLFPAATAVHGSRMLVANLALPLTAARGDEWEEDVTRWNLMQFDLPSQASR